MKQVLKAEGGLITKSNTWHKDLLSASVSQKIISEQLSNKLYEYLTFRHFFVHGYGFMLEDAPLADLANEAPAVWAQFISEIENHTRQKLKSGN